MKKQLLLLVMMLLPMVAMADNSGTCGANLTWTFVESTGTLTISGTGAMYDYSSSSSYRAPWYNNRGQVLALVIEDGVTSIGDYAFQSCTKLTSVVIPNSVIYIGYRAFYYCTGVPSIMIPKSVKSIGTGACARTQRPDYHQISRINKN